jgi:hypothetical protein
MGNANPIGRASAVVRFMDLRVRILPVTWMSLSYDCSVLSGRVLCVGPFTGPEESHRVSNECDHEVP